MEKSLIAIFLFSLVFISCQKLNYVQYLSTISNGYTSEKRTDFLMFYDNEHKYFFNIFFNQYKSSVFKDLMDIPEDRAIDQLISYNPIENVYKEVKWLSNNLNKTYYTIDKTSINWEVSREEKSILGYKCQKATTNFRGRDWTVWFTKDVPVQFGPWKLDGLPGLILEAEDNKKMFSYQAERIVLNNDEKYVFKIKKMFEDEEFSFPYKTFILLENKSIEMLNSQSMSQLDIGNIALDNHQSLRSLYPEKTFEWEDPKKP